MKLFVPYPLFASFAILMNFPRFNKMKGMGQIVTWSVRDETLHCLSMIKLFNSFINENQDIWDDELKQEITDCCKITVEHEDAFIDLCFNMGPIEGMAPEDVKQYIRYIGDRRLQQLGLEPIYHVTENPLPWMDEMLNGAEHTNFFENRSTEYAKAQNLKIYDSINDGGRKKASRPTNTPKHKEGDGADNN